MSETTIQRLPTKETPAKKKTTAKKMSTASIELELIELNRSIEDRFSRQDRQFESMRSDMLALTEHVQRVDEELDSKGDKFKIPTVTDFKFFVTKHISNICMVLVLIWGIHMLVTTDTFRGWINLPPIIHKDNDGNNQQNNNNNNNRKPVDPLAGTMEDVSHRFANAVSNVAALSRSLNTLANSIDGAYNPVSELRSVIQFEAADWRDSVGEKFLRERANGTASSTLVKQMVAGLGSPSDMAGERAPPEPEIVAQPTPQPTPVPTPVPQPQPNNQRRGLFR